MINSRGRILETDLAEILKDSEEFLSGLKKSRILIAGATGFVGTWLMAAILEGNDKFSLDIEVSVLTSNIQNARHRLHLKERDPVQFVEWVDGDVSIRNLGAFDFVVFAIPPIVNSNHEIVDGNSRDVSILVLEEILRNINRQKNVPTVMYLSSGAVYENYVTGFSPILEKDITLVPTFSNSSYSNTKITSESLILEATNQGTIKGTTPRLFTFAGPHLPLNSNFAVANFLADNLAGKQIEIKGNPETTRSYMYPTDMCTWLMSLLVKPTSQPIHIGSEHTITIQDLADLVDKQGMGVTNLFLDTRLTHYVPSTLNSREYLGVYQKVSLETALSRWRNWLLVQNIRL
jgi:dTDP-glucose 4,6-dehydratase